jgi:hypothetical protein
MYLRYENSQGNADEAWTVGSSTWQPIAGTFSFCTGQSSIATAECDALVALYRSADGPNWDLNSNWLTDPDPCSWAGVVCDTDSVSGLRLSNNQLSGTIPPELADLTNLTGLGLSGNQLSGTIPPELADLTNLRGLVLSGNQLSGEVPPELMTLSFLSTLSLRDQSGCLTAATPALAAWLTGYDPLWNNGCPAP